MDFWQAIQPHISHINASPFILHSRTPVSGGDINQAFAIKRECKAKGARESCFVKFNLADKQAMIERLPAQS